MVQKRKMMLRRLDLVQIFLIGGCRMYALYEPLSLHLASKRDRGRMKQLLWFLVWFVWGAMGTITTQQFFAPQNSNMKITSPIRELLVLSELQCAMACKQNSTCLSYSVTYSSGSLICRFGYRYDEPRAADADSKFFYRDVPAGYNLVPGTRSYVKMTVQSIPGSNTATACKNEGSLLVSSTDEAVHNYTKQLWANRPSGSNFVVGGVSVANRNTWIFPDGTNLTVTGLGQAGFCSSEPNGDPGYCLHFWVHDPFPCWADTPCSTIYDGYICEIKVPD
ncbi:unnamed protein product [Darwinula stevensoni]|uniref:C-type lectin domain-containing protein n=1 Tax=Darwinula stevensoni TaxID=69355 RepID=A0A7R9FSN2_9CRUS|nr:unnamed protein product [Darwinula stevensoni]CAG0904113.1 unnamed protein product [Darwinula stevensoni]